MRLIAENVGKVFPGRRNGSPINALDQVSVPLGGGEFVCLLGPSGCGKSTLLHIFAGLEVPSSGSVYFEGAGDKIPSTSMVFQQFALFPWMSILDNVAFPLRIQGVGMQERNDRARHFLKMMMLEGFEQAFPRELSGGMQQRVAIARALMTDPDFMLMDEPFGALDAQTRLLLQEELLRIWEATRNGVLFVTHSIEEALLLGDTIHVFSARPGRIRETITVPFPRPRDAALRSSREFIEMHDHVWGLLRNEAVLSVNN